MSASSASSAAAFMIVLHCTAAALGALLWTRNEAPEPWAAFAEVDDGEAGDEAGDRLAAEIRRALCSLCDGTDSHPVV